MAFGNLGLGKVFNPYYLGTASFLNPGVVATMATLSLPLKQAGGSQAGFQVGRMGPYQTTS